LPIVTSRACANVQKGVELVQALLDEHKDYLQQNVVEVIHILQASSSQGSGRLSPPPAHGIGLGTLEQDALTHIQLPIPTSSSPPIGAGGAHSGSEAEPQWSNGQHCPPAALPSPPALTEIEIPGHFITVPALSLSLTTPHAHHMLTSGSLTGWLGTLGVSGCNSQACWWVW